jgi:hypothetical protein
MDASRTGEGMAFARLSLIMKAPWIVTTRHSRPENGDIAKWDRNLSTTFGLGPRQFKRGAKLLRLIPQMTVFAMQTGSNPDAIPPCGETGSDFCPDRSAMMKRCAMQAGLGPPAVLGQLLGRIETWFGSIFKLIGLTIRLSIGWFLAGNWDEIWADLGYVSHVALCRIVAGNSAPGKKP